MPATSTRLLLGFGSAALAHLVFQGALGAILYALELLPALVWSLEPVPPLGVPKTLNNMFWDGLWGMLYGLIEPRLTPRVGRMGGGLVLGLASLLVFWLVVLPLKGVPIGMDGAELALGLAFDLMFGLGTAILFWAGLGLVRGRTALRSPALPERT